MASRTEITIPHEKLMDPSTVTQVQSAALAERGFDIHKDEIVTIDEDYSTKKRFLRVRTPKSFFFMGGKGR